MSLDQAARSALLQAIEDLMRVEPDRWPEIVAQLSGAACHLNPGQLSLLADAATQVAATAHQLQQEAQEEDG